MLRIVSGIVLRTFKYKESSAIIHLYTKEYGRINGIMGGVYQSGKKSRSKSAILQPISCVEVEIYIRNNKSLYRIKNVRSSIFFSNIHFDIKRNAIAIFIAEVLYLVLQEEEANQDLFGFIYHSIQILDQSEQKINIFHHKFLIELARYLGFYPEMNYDEKHRYFDIRKGGFVSDYDGNFCLDNQTSKLLVSLNIIKMTETSQCESTKDERNKLLHGLLDFYYYHIHGMKPLKSLDVIKEIFS